MSPDIDPEEMLAKWRAEASTVIETRHGTHSKVVYVDGGPGAASVTSTITFCPDCDAAALASARWKMQLAPNPTRTLAMLDVIEAADAMMNTVRHKREPYEADLNAALAQLWEVSSE